MEQPCPTDMEAVRGRLQDLLKRRKVSARQLAGLTGDEPKNVQRWLSNTAKGKTGTIPADFIGRCETVGFSPARYILTGEGSDQVVAPEEGPLRLQAIRRIVNGEVDGATLRELSRPGSAGATSRALAKRLRGKKASGEQGR